MKKYLKQALIFAIYGLCTGVFYREFSKGFGYEERTMLGMAHAHVLMLGFFGMLVIGLFVRVLNMQENKSLKMANIIYCAGVVALSVMMIVRGIFEVVKTELSGGANGAISGLAGLAHILMAAGIVRFAIAFYKKAKEQEK